VVRVAMRLLRAIAVLVAGCACWGCIATQMKATSSRPVNADMEIFAQAMIEQHTMDTLCLFPFGAAPENWAASPSITAAYLSRLVQRRPFLKIRAVPYEPKSDSEAIWYARYEGCTLAMLPSLLYVMDGTGSMPTELTVRIRILDARTGGVLWDIKQEGRSEPGPDIDLYWNTITGQPAQRRSVLADCLSRRFAEYLVHPLEKEKEK